MKKSRFLVFLLSLSATLVLFDACKPDKEEEDLVNNYDRAALLANVVNNYIVPAYSDYLKSVKDLNDTWTAFGGNLNSSTLSDLRTNYFSLATKWQSVAFLEFGPAADISLRAQTNVFPVDTALMNLNSKGGTFDLAQVNQFDAKGIQALDYLLHHPSYNSEADLLTFLNSSACQAYFTAIVNDLLTNGNYVNDKWSTYQATFIANNNSNAEGSAMSIIVNALSSHYEAYVRKGKLGIPAGVFNGFSQQAMPGHVEAYYSGKSLDLLKASVAAIHQFYEGIAYNGGNNGEGLSDYLTYVQVKKDDVFLSAAISLKIQAINDALALLNDPLSNDVLNNKAKVNEAYEEMQQLVSIVKVDLTAALGVLITYQDTDGD